MSKRGALSFGCVLWGALILFAAIVGWKFIDFYILGPAAVKRALNMVGAHVSDTLNRDSKLIEFRRLWIELYNESEDLPEIDSPTFSGDTFIVTWVDSIPIPGFPAHRHTFRLRKFVR